MSRAEVVAYLVYAFLNRHPGVAVIVAGIGARKATGLPDIARETINRLLYDRVYDFNCIQASILNAVFAEAGNATGEFVRGTINKNDLTFFSLRPVGGVLNSMKYPSVRCSAVRDLKIQRCIQKSDRFAAFNETAKREYEIFIVRLR